MKTLHLHIGTNKTGTTTIQRFLAGNRERLRAQGVFYPLKGATAGGNHSLFARDLQQHSDGKIARAAVWEGFLQAADASPLPRVIVSGEVFWSFRRQLPHVQRMIDDIKAHFSDIRIVCYLRRQDLYLRSCYVQAVKSGRSALGFHAYVDSIAIGKKLGAYQYDSSLALWAGAFGRDRIIVRPFERQQLHPDGLVADFCQACGLDVARLDAVPAQDANVSPGNKVLAALLYAQRQLPARRGTHLAARRQTALCSAMAAQLAAEWDDTPFTGFRNGEARAFYARFAEGNARVAREYLGRADGRLFHDERFQELPEGTDEAVVLTRAEEARVDALVAALRAQLPDTGSDDGAD